MDSEKCQNLDHFRSYLLHLARLHMDRNLQAKCSPSDLVQNTLLEAHQSLPGFRGQTLAQQIAWLRKILVNRAAKIGRDLRRQKRDFRREESLEASMIRSSERLQEFLIAQTPSPSAEAMREEHLLLVADTLEKLPEIQREVVLLHFIEGLTMAEIGERIGRSSTASAGLLHRGLKRLRELLRDEDRGESRGSD